MGHEEHAGGALLLCGELSWIVSLCPLGRQGFKVHQEAAEKYLTEGFSKMILLKGANVAGGGRVGGAQAVAFRHRVRNGISPAPQLGKAFLAIS